MDALAALNGMEPALAKFKEALWKYRYLREELLDEPGRISGLSPLNSPQQAKLRDAASALAAAAQGVVSAEESFRKEF
jgi:hypothetical protein